MLSFEPTVPQRRRFGLFLLSAYREFRAVYPGGFESFLVAMSAAMGNRHTGRPINVSSIAEMTGIPRATVIRKLHLLKAGPEPIEEGVPHPGWLDPELRIAALAALP